MPTTAVEAAARGRLPDYLRRTPLERCEELAAHEAFISGFHYGARWMGRLSLELTAVCNPEFRQAIAVLAEVLREE